MARIRALEPGSQTVRRHPTEVDCYYSVVTDGNGDLLHLSTFGSDDRQSDPKSSQSIQLDEAAAGQLLDIIVKAFPTLSQRLY
ncbi:hypothetical protein GCM10009551_091010 [Nocardiopsis tropica]|nr:hypothetical protein TTY48_39960 [Tsukamurella sp. TY48]